MHTKSVCYMVNYTALVIYYMNLYVYIYIWLCDMVCSQ